MSLSSEIFRHGLRDSFLFLFGLATGITLMLLVSNGQFDFQLPSRGNLGSKMQKNSDLTRSPFQKEILAAAAAEGIDPEILFAIVEIESGHDPMAVSESGAEGLGQLMPEIQRAFGVDDPFDPAQNLAGSAAFLGVLTRKYDRLELAVAAYHAGEPLVDRCTCVPRPVDAEYVRRFFEVFKPVHLPYRVDSTLVDNGFHGEASWAGRDYTADCKTPLYAPISGQVSAVGMDNYIGPYGSNNSFMQISGTKKYSGLKVVLLHGDYSASIGDRVTQGVSRIGSEASIGNSSGCHTHLIVKYQDRLLDPMQVVR